MEKRISKLIILSVTYGMVFLLGTLLMFHFSIYKFEFIGEFNLREWIIPAGIAVCVLFGLGLLVAQINLYIFEYMQGSLKSTILKVSLGSVAGALPLFFWNMATGSFPETYYPSMEYVPFLIGGFAVAMGLSWMNKLYEKRRN